ncbi:MAG TPA: response regulator [Bacilli bacterium]
MYNILIVDDEPLICKGLSNLLSSAGLDIENVFTAYSGHEALDYLRMEDIDLLVTDIQMGVMSGIELMHQAKIIKPWVQTIIISAHETFQYAQLAIRLGAKDYIIKPIQGDQFLDSVRNVLLKMEKNHLDQEQLLAKLRQDFHMDEPPPAIMEVLRRLMNDPANFADFALLKERYQIDLSGPYFSVIKVRLDLARDSEGHELTDRDRALLRYASLNIINELLEKEWSHCAFYSADREISIIIQWNENNFQEQGGSKINHLDMIGRSVHHNISRYLGVSCVVGISQILKGREFLGVLNEQARKAIDWNREHNDHNVFYYGDFNLRLYADDPTSEELSAQNNTIVREAKEYIDRNYMQKGLTLQEVAQKKHVSPNYLSYLFKKYTGYNVWEYVIKQRMEESKRLLMNTDLRRYEIAEKVGYESPEHFSKIFKKYFGVSPSDMKK